MHVLVDTHALIWLAADDSRLSRRARDVLMSIDNHVVVSAVTAFEYADLISRGRLPNTGLLKPLLDALDAEVRPLPADLWRRAADLPNIHGDPVDRMLVAHAMAESMPLLSADGDIGRYPVEVIW